MKKLIPLMMCLVLSVMAFAQTGVDFQHLTFDEALAKAKAEKKLVFVDCYTTWCGPCKTMTPIIKEIAKEHNEIKFVKVDVDKNEELAIKYNVMSIPTMIIMKDGKVTKTFVGVTDKESIIREF